MSFLDSFDTAAGGGAYDLSEEERKRAQQAALMNAGMAMLSQSGWSTMPTTGAQGLASGIAGAQQGYGQAAQGIQQQSAARQQLAAEREAKARDEAFRRTVTSPEFLARVDPRQRPMIETMGPYLSAPTFVSNVLPGILSAGGEAPEPRVLEIHGVPYVHTGTKWEPLRTGKTSDGFRQLSSEEKTQLGLPAQGVYQRGPKGNITQVYAPNSRSGDFANAGTLRKEYDTQVKPFKEISQAYAKVESAAENPSAAGDLSLIFGYMKMLDPGSVVREGEFATAQNAAGVPDRLRNLYNRAAKGERLAPEQRADFLNQARLVRDSQQAYVNGLRGRYTELATSYGLDPARIVYDPFSGGVEQKEERKRLRYNPATGEFEEVRS